VRGGARARKPGGISLSLGACGREPAHARRYVDGGDGDSPVARARAVQWALGRGSSRAFTASDSEIALAPGCGSGSVSAKGLGFARDIPCSAGDDVAAGRACTLGEPEI
jgi:hypothetical protein